MASTGFRTARGWRVLFPLFLLAGGGWPGGADAVAAQDGFGEWHMPNRDHTASNYSPLDQIRLDNVQDLRVAWTFATGIMDTHEAQPLVVGTTMYVITPKPNHVYALDLEREGVIRWEFRPEFENLERTITYACCGGQTRGMTYHDGRLYFNTLDGQLFALDAEDGTVVWRVEAGDLDVAETMTTAPLVVRGNVIVGVAGGERGVRGWVTAYDAETGERRWRSYSMGPNEEMGIGPRFRPFYPADSIENPGISTWYGDSWRRGGGSMWGWFSYDPELNLFYYGTGNCSPWNPDYRRPPTDDFTPEGVRIDEYSNKYCASLMARDPDTGELIWVYQFTLQDQWDLDEPGQNFLVDMELGGELRRTIVKAARNGLFYVIDRETGELLQEPVFHTGVNWAIGFDWENVRPIVNPDMIMRTDELKHVCPWLRTSDWENHAYSPRTGLVYFASTNLCRDLMMREGDYVPGENYELVDHLGSLVPGVDGPHWGELQAWDPVHMEKVWGLKSEGITNRKPVLATAGDLLFQGTDEGLIRAMDARTGEIIWSFRTGTDFRNAPISYLGPDGKQYIAIISSRPPFDPVVRPETPPDDAGRLRRSGSVLYVFGLP